MKTHTPSLRAWFVSRFGGLALTSLVLLTLVMLVTQVAAQAAPPDEDASGDEDAPGIEAASPDQDASGVEPAASDEDSAGDAGAARPDDDTFASRRIAHRPLMQAPSTGAQLRFLVARPGDPGEVLVFVRPLGSTDEPAAVPVVMTSEGFVATLSPEHLHLTGSEYWVVLRDEASGRERPIFASADDPQPIVVIEPRRRRLEREALADREGRRNTFRLGGEVVQLGPSGGYYLRATASYAHHFLTALETIEVGVGVTRAMVDGPNDPGVDYGRADLTLRLHERMRLRVALALGFSEDGFTLGGGAYALLGKPFGTHVELGGEYLADVGYLARVRLGFDTVPHVPLGATIEVTNFPLDGDANVRLLLDAAYRFAPDTYVRLVVGYRGQQATRGGISVGLDLAYSF